MVMKGLELQETSCHTVEAIRVHEMCFRMLLCMNASLWKLWANMEATFSVHVTHWYSTLTQTPKNVLTGVIDHTEICERIQKNFFKTGELLQRPKVRQYKGRHTTASHNRPYEGKSTDAKWSFTSYTLQGGFIWHLSQWCVDENLPQPQLLKIKNSPQGLLGLNAVQVALCLVWVTECGVKKGLKWMKASRTLENTSSLLALVLFLQLTKV